MTEASRNFPASAEAATSLHEAYAYCMAITRGHYENFPVAALFLPRRLRRPISAIYAFARTADDLADEGQRTKAERLKLLDEYDRTIDALSSNVTVMNNPIFVALRDVIEKYNVRPESFHELLTAFRMDVTETRYANFDKVLHYCRYSANPVGHLVLQLSNAGTPENVSYSDSICTALQLVNFLQDIEQDYRENGRIYLPQDEMADCRVSESDIAECRNTPALKRLIDIQIHRARRMLEFGRPLGSRLGGRLGLQIRLTVHGGLRVLEAIDSGTDVFSRPRLGIRDWAVIAVRALAGK